MTASLQTRVTRLARHGLSAAEIAARLMKPYLTIARLLPQGSPGAAAADDTPAVAARPCPLPTPEPGTAAAPVEGPTCRWINGDPALPGWSFCGEPAVIGPVQGNGVWCAAHRARVYEPAGMRRLKSADRYIREAGTIAALPGPLDEIPTGGAA